MQPASPCGQREELKKLYRAAIRAYRETVGYLDADHTQLQRAYRDIEAAHEAFQKARDELRKHIKTHGCRP